LNLVDYFNSDFAGCKLDKKNTSVTCHILESSIISWHNKKQACMTLLTLEAKYIVTGIYCI